MRFFSLILTKAKQILRKLNQPSYKLPETKEALNGEISAKRDATPISTAWKLKKVLGIGSEKVLKDCVKEIHEFVSKIVDERKKNMTVSKNKDLLSRMITCSVSEELRRADDRVTYFPYGMGRMENLWGMGRLQFRPDRWFDCKPTENGETLFMKEVSPYKYPVFHACPRVCLGKGLANAQMSYVDVELERL
ncbi:hypothetical protein L1887_29913 [Cichorium endivia]|nr:hypothetical protein L1887_29913 [Cichorium endivia]